MQIYALRMVKHDGGGESVSHDPVLVPALPPHWRGAYAETIASLPTIVRSARSTLCGLGACVDATVSLYDAAALTGATQPQEAVALGAALLERAETGTGGEIRVDWPSGPEWLDRRLPLRLELGGSGPHAARALTVLGAPAVLALETRSAEQLSVLDPEMMLAERGRLRPARSVEPTRRNAVKIYIFEYTEGRPLHGVVPPRSSRIIVRFTDPGLENDDDFEELSVAMAPQAGAGILSGFSAIGSGDLAGPLDRARRLSKRWIAAGLPTVHLELAGFDRPHYRDGVLTGLSGAMTSLGLSLSEFQALIPLPLADGMVALGERFGLRRVSVHADTWAASATRDDPAIEREAQLLGCLLASTRAAHGRPAIPTALPDDAGFEEPPALPEALGAWHIVACATPHLTRPVTTVGLGDTFMAGCLLALGRYRHERHSVTPMTNDRTRPQ